MFKQLLLAGALACLIGAGVYLLLDDPEVATAEPPESLAFDEEDEMTTSSTTTSSTTTSSTTTTGSTTSSTSTTTSTTLPPSTTVPPTTAAPTTTKAPPTSTTTAALTTTAGPTTTTTVAPSGNKIQQAAAESLAQLNATRASVGLDPLVIDPAMSTFAVDWSREMIATGFKHSSGPYAENIAWHSNGNMSPQAAAQHFNQGWVDSPGHYANMTNSRWTHVGIGLVPHESGWWATHVFR